MHTTFLVQRLNRPHKTEWHAKVGRAFGGESKIAMGEEGFKVLRDIFSIAYMGAAEYEFGILPAALSALVADQDKLVSFRMVMTAKDIKPNWQRESAYRDARRKVLNEAREKGVRPPRAKKLVADIKPKTLYVLCRNEHQTDVMKVIQELALDKVHTKAGHNMARALDPITEYDSETQGWLELDNGWFAFLDKEMWQKTCALFGCKTEETESEVPNTVQENLNRSTTAVGDLD